MSEFNNQTVEMRHIVVTVEKVSEVSGENSNKEENSNKAAKYMYKGCKMVSAFKYYLLHMMVFTLNCMLKSSRVFFLPK